MEIGKTHSSFRAERLLTNACHLFFTLYVVSLATSMAGMELFSGLLAAGLIGLFLLKAPPRSRWEAPPYLLPMAVFAAVMIAGIVLGSASTREKWYDIGRTRFFLLYAAIFYYLRFLAGSPRRWLYPLAVVTAFIGIYGFFQHFIPLDLFRPAGKKIILYALPDKQIGPLVLGTFNHHLTFTSVYLFHACLFLAIGILGKSRPALALGALLSLLCLWTHSRMAWIAVPACIALLGLIKGRRAAGMIAGLTVIALAVAFALDAGFRERLTRTFAADDSYNLNPRTRLWRLQWEMFKDSPLVGLGYNNNERRASEYFDRVFPGGTFRFVGHAHSNFLQILSSTGALGLAAFVAIWWLVLAKLLRSARFLARGSLEWCIAVGIAVGFIGFHIQGITQWNFGDAEVLHNVLFFWAVSAALRPLGSEAGTWRSPLLFSRPTGEAMG